MRLALLFVAACGDNVAGENRQGGDTTVDDRTQLAFRQPAANLDDSGRARFQAGRSPFDFDWESTGKVGPLFNNNACLGCHGGNGRGLSQIGFGLVSQALVRVSVVDESDAHGGPAPVPGFGTQLQDHAIGGLPEVNVTLRWIDVADSYGDGEQITLREPRLDIKTPLGEFLPSSTRYSYRTAPPLIGLGLLEAIELVDDPSDADGDGISGRINRVWDPEQQATVNGRFGWKANTSRLHIQVPGAFDNDMGLTSYVFPSSDPTDPFEVSNEQLEDTVFFSSTIAVPAAALRDDAAWRGRALFDDFGCAGCHVPAHVTGAHAIGELANQRIHPYTDLLVHDMGDRLADGRMDFLADSTEWRTPALWGIGLTQVVNPQATFLHDGRARTLAEAILWHGGEAQAAREAFRNAARADRDALLAFLATL